MGKHLVLVGGGHAHLTALAHLGCYVRRGHRATLISPFRYHYYSGMGSGMLSGLYEPRQVRFNIQRMVEERGGQFIEGSVTAVDPAAQKLYLDNDVQESYDIASFNIGSVVSTAELATADEHVFTVKPILNLYKARNLILSQSAKGITEFWLQEAVRPALKSPPMPGNCCTRTGPLQRSPWSPETRFSMVFPQGPGILPLLLLPQGESQFSRGSGCVLSRTDVRHSPMAGSFLSTLPSWPLEFSLLHCSGNPGYPSEKTEACRSTGAFRAPPTPNSLAAGIASVLRGARWQRSEFMQYGKTPFLSIILKSPSMEVK